MLILETRPVVIGGDMPTKTQRLPKQFPLDAILRRGSKHSSSFGINCTTPRNLIFIRMVIN